MSKTISIPVDAFNKSIDEEVITDIVRFALFDAGPVVALNHVWGSFNEFKQDLTYRAAVKLAGWAMRYAWEMRNGR